METINQAADENSLQPCFVLHKASRPVRESSGKCRRMPKVSNDSNVEGSGQVDSRLQSYHSVWTPTESIIEDVLKKVNSDVFDKVACWIHESFNVIQSRRLPESTKAAKTYPLLIPTSFKQLFTALVFTSNMEFVDDIQTFGDLAQHLKSQGCHVANLSSSDFSAKNGVGGCLRSLLRQFLAITTDVGDISILASWYCEQGHSENPIVVIIDCIERCCGSVLSDFIVILSEWAGKIPILLILGVTTTTDAVRDIVPSNVLNYLSSTKFILGSPTEKLDRVIEAVLVKHSGNFSVGQKVANFLRNYFVMHDGTLMSFIRALKMASFQHFVLQSPSFSFTQPIEDIRLREVGCFENVDKLQSALMGDPRRTVQVDLLDSQKFLKCSCCKINGILLPSMHDTSVMYSLAQEHGDLINLHDLFQSFKATITNSSKRSKNRLKQKQSPKKRKISSEPQSTSDASIQARFCRAVTELQITGLLRMPSKRRPDFVHRVAFGV